MAVKPQKTKKKDVDALTFMQTVIMSFVRGMECGEQTLPTNDLFVYLPVQLPAMERQGFTPAQGKGSCIHRPKEEGAEDNPLLDRYSRMPDTSWTERACSCGALDPSFGTSYLVPFPYGCALKSLCGET